MTGILVFAAPFVVGIRSFVADAATLPAGAEVLDADPQADISAVRQVHMVIKAGQGI